MSESQKDWNASERAKTWLTVTTRTDDAGPALAVTSSDVSTDHVIRRIQQLVETVIAMLDEPKLPVLLTSCCCCSAKKSITKTFHLHQCRSFTGILLVLSYCHTLLLSKRTTTTREVYYYYVTHFRSQKECDAAILDAATLLQVPRHALGLIASPRGWFAGDLQLLQDNNNNHIILDGRACWQSPIVSDWLLTGSSNRPFTLATQAARCILVIEKEGVYHRLCQDGFFRDFPCILVTGKGFPDLATRAFVHAVHTELGLPVYGLADCDPFGILVLHTYQYGSSKRVEGGSRYSVPMQWLGLRPSQLQHLKLPPEVFQKLTDLDTKRLESLLNSDHRWTQAGQSDRRLQELEEMYKTGRKVELEALNWLGMEFCSEWLTRILKYNEKLEQGFIRDDDLGWMEII